MKVMTTFLMSLTLGQQVLPQPFTVLPTESNTTTALPTKHTTTTTKPYDSIRAKDKSNETITDTVKSDKPATAKPGELTSASTPANVAAVHRENNVVAVHLKSSIVHPHPAVLGSPLTVTCSVGAIGGVGELTNIDSEENVVDKITLRKDNAILAWYQPAATVKTLVNTSLPGGVDKASFTMGGGTKSGHNTHNARTIHLTMSVDKATCSLAGEFTCTFEYFNVGHKVREKKEFKDTATTCTQKASLTVTATPVVQAYSPGQEIIFTCRATEPEGARLRWRVTRCDNSTVDVIKVASWEKSAFVVLQREDCGCQSIYTLRYTHSRRFCRLKCDAERRLVTKDQGMVNFTLNKTRTLNIKHAGAKVVHHPDPVVSKRIVLLVMGVMFLLAGVGTIGLVILCGEENKFPAVKTRRTSYEGAAFSGMLRPLGQVEDTEEDEAASTHGITSFRNTPYATEAPSTSSSALELDTDNSVILH